MGADCTADAGTAALGASAPGGPADIVDAILSLASSGGAWRLLPKEFAPFSTMQKYFYRWRDEGVLRGINETLVRAAREREGRTADPTAGVIDSQSVRTTQEGGPRGFDAGKKVMGRKRHIVVDRPGLMVGLVVHAANVQDRDGAPLALSSIIKRWPINRWPNLHHVFADGAHAGPKLKAALEKIGRFTIQIVKRSDAAKGFEILPRRRVVERTFAWLGRCRRLARDFERTIASAEAWVFVANIRLITRRIA